VAEKAPQVYKPREGQINSNIEKYYREDIDFIYQYAKDYIVKLGYEEVFTCVP
jgi:hypothetical protein